MSSLLHLLKLLIIIEDIHASKRVLLPLSHLKATPSQVFNQYLHHSQL